MSLSVIEEPGLGVEPFSLSPEHFISFPRGGDSCVLFPGSQRQQLSNNPGMTGLA